MKKILIVDDNRDLAEGLAELFREEGHSVVMAHTGAEARAEFAEDAFHFVFLDLMLPDENGLDLFHEFHKESPGTHVLIMTGHRIEQVLQQATDSGSVAVLRKPFSAERALECIRDAGPEAIVLVVDDDPGCAKGIASVLEQNGRRTVIARDGREALDKATGSNDEVLILDTRLPVLCGLDIYLTLKQQGKVAPTVLVTGYPEFDSDNIDQLRQTSVTNCLFKPFDPEKLINMVSDTKLKESI